MIARKTQKETDIFCFVLFFKHLRIQINITQNLTLPSFLFCFDFFDETQQNNRFFVSTRAYYAVPRRTRRYRLFFVVFYYYYLTRRMICSPRSITERLVRLIVVEKRVLKLVSGATDKKISPPLLVHAGKVSSTDKIKAMFHNNTVAYACLALEHTTGRSSRLYPDEPFLLKLLCYVIVSCKYVDTQIYFGCLIGSPRCKVVHRIRSTRRIGT